jgi:hypothetical protein
MRRWKVWGLLAAVLAADLPDRIAAGLGSGTALPELTGGAATYVCILLGIAAGFSLATGNPGGLLATLVGADLAGCF